MKTHVECPLFIFMRLWKPWIEPVDKDISVDQCRPEYRVSLASTRVPQRLSALMQGQVRFRAVVVCK